MASRILGRAPQGMTGEIPKGKFTFFFGHPENACGDNNAEIGIIFLARLVPWLRFTGTPSWRSGSPLSAILDSIVVGAAGARGSKNQSNLQNLAFVCLKYLELGWDS